MREGRARDARLAEPSGFGPPLASLRCFANPSDLVDGLSDEIVHRLTAAVAERGHASLVVPGAEPHRLLFDGLCGRAAPWKAVTITLTDEHWAPGDPGDRNEHAVRTRLLTGRAKAAQFLPYPGTGLDPSAAATAADRAVARLARPFDVTVVGVSADGHVAGLSADALELGGGDLVRAVCSPAFRPTPHRLTLTGAALDASRFVALAVMGGEPFAALQRALQGEPSPIGRLLQRRGRSEVFWCP